jgi:hypothetical protein
MSKDKKVGYKNPPHHSRFKPGQSGNPRGKKKGTNNFQTDLMEELRERIPIKESGRKITVSKQRAMIKTLTAKALQGDVRATNVILNTLNRWVQDEPDQKDGVDLTRADKAILKRFEDQVLLNANKRSKKDDK